jgi:NAD(P)-dependent dehydrogenase (short-subunit alcohol dehydrogenase family)
MPNLTTEPDLRGTFSIVTGGAKGIGLATVRAFARLGAHVLIASRDAAIGSAAAEELNRELGSNRVKWAFLDLASFASIRSFAKEIGSRVVDVLVNNAGVMGGPLRRTKEGFEWQFGINFIGPFLLSTLLANNLAKGRNPRIVQLSSGAHRFAPFDFTDPNFDDHGYDSDLAYQRSKTACALFAVAFQARYGRLGIDAFSASPGIVKTDLLNVMGRAAIEKLLVDCASLVRTADQAAATILYAATSPELAGKGGLYIEDGAPAQPATDDFPGGVMPHALDPVAADRLWKLAERYVQTPPRT